MPFDPAKPLRRRRHGCDPEKFCQEMFAGTPLHAAYEIAGFKRPRGNAERLEQDPQVAERLEYLRKRIAAGEETMIALRRIKMRCQLEAIVEIDRSAMFDAGGNLKPLDQLTPAQCALIETIEPTRQGPKAVMPSKLVAMARLADIDGLDAPTKVAATDPTGAQSVPIGPTINLFGHTETPPGAT